MYRLVIVVALIVSAMMAGAPRTYAGKDRVQIEMKNVGDAAATALKAELSSDASGKDGTFFSWLGNLGKQNNLGALLFEGNNPAGQNNFTENFINGRTLAPAGFMTLQAVVTTGSKLDSAISALKNNAGNVRTKFDPLDRIIRKPMGDFAVDISNNTQSAVTLMSLEVRVNNTQDPYDLSQEFMPDGQIVLSLSSPTVLSPGQDLTFAFSDPSNPNSVLSVVSTEQDSEGDTFTGLLATTIPEPGTIMLVGIGGLTMFAGLRRRGVKGVNA